MFFVPRTHEPRDVKDVEMASKRSERVSSATSALVAKSEVLRRELESLLSEFGDEVRSGGVDPLSGTLKFDAEAEKWRGMLAEVVPRLSEMRDELHRRRAEIADGYEARLTRHLREAGHAVFGDGSPWFIDGVVQVEVDKEKGTARVNGSLVDNLSAAAISTEVEAHLASLKKNSVEPAVMLAQLLEAYNQEIRGLAKPMGTQVTTLSLLPHLLLARQSPGFRTNPSARAFREYTRAQFVADLYGVLEADVGAVAGHHFRHAAGADTGEAVFLFVPALKRTGYLARIWFELSDNP